MKKIILSLFVLTTLLFAFNTILLAEKEVVPETVPAKKLKTAKTVAAAPELIEIKDSKVSILSKTFTLPKVEEMELLDSLTLNNLNNPDNKSVSFFYLKEFPMGTFNPQDYLDKSKIVTAGMADDFIIVTLHFGEKDFTEQYFAAFAKKIEEESKKDGLIIAEKTNTSFISYDELKEDGDSFYITNSVSLVNGSLVEVNKAYIAESALKSKQTKAEINKAIVEKHSAFINEFLNLNK